MASGPAGADAAGGTALVGLAALEHTGWSVLGGFVVATELLVKEAIGKFPGQLDKVATSRHMADDALDGYATDLEHARGQADRATSDGKRPASPTVGACEARVSRTWAVTTHEATACVGKP